MTPIRIVVITKFGDVDVVKVLDSTCPPPSIGQLQVATEYSGFTGGDFSMRMGIYPGQIPAPLTPGYCLVGTVRALGDKCTLFQPGDTVSVLTKYDAEAELVNQPERYCIKVPDGLDHQQDTALLCDWSTAYAMTMHTAKVTTGQRVFIHGLSGAVGCGLMMLCYLRGAKVYGTASELNNDMLRAHAAHPFVYTDKVWMDEMKKLGGAHVVFDPLGYESFDESYDILTLDGILVAYVNNKDSLEKKGAPRSAETAVLKMMGENDPNGKRTTFFGLTRDEPTYATDVMALMELLQKGAIKIPIKNVWDMEDIQTAHKHWGGGSGIGSLLIKVGKT
jgi:NADPH:quinone reductase-like Zn-dependent oxidoreductase